METVRHLTRAELETGLDQVRSSPRDAGRLELIVRRPAVGEREELDVGVLDPAVGLVGDTWRDRPSSRTSDGSAHPEMQVTLMNARAAALVAVDPDRRALAGDQLYVDLDLSAENIPPGTRLALADAVLEVTAEPHRGCAKFSERFGVDAVRVINSPEGQALNLRGVNARVVTGGEVRVGDIAHKLPARSEPA